MFAVIKTGGRQFRVVPDDVLEIGKIAGDVGTIVQLGEVLLVGGDQPVLGTPTVALFGPSNAVKWGPWPKDYAEDRNPWGMRGTQRVNNVVLLQGEGDCVPCMLEGCDRHNDSLSECLQKLPAARAIDALRELLI